MPKIFAERMTPRIEGDFVVFPIGVRINKKAFNASVGKSRGDVGIWHETCHVRAGESEAIYGGMPEFGLGAAGKLIPVSRASDGARERIRPAPKH